MSRGRSRPHVPQSNRRVPPRVREQMLIHPPAFPVSAVRTQICRIPREARSRSSTFRAAAKAPRPSCSAPQRWERPAAHLAARTAAQGALRRHRRHATSSLARGENQIRSQSESQSQVGNSAAAS